MPRLVAHSLGGGDPALDSGGLGGAAAQVALDRGPVLAADDLAVAREEALLGLGRVARRRGGAAVGLDDVGFRRRLGDGALLLDCGRSRAAPLADLLSRGAALAGALGFGLAVRHLVGIHGRQRGSIALV